MATNTDLSSEMRKAEHEPRANDHSVSVDGSNKPRGRASSFSEKGSAQFGAAAANPAAANPAAASLPKRKCSPARKLYGAPRGDGRREPVVSLDNLEKARRIKKVLNSPRSLKACGMEGIEPAELLPRELADFMGTNVPESLAQTRLMHFENRRKEKMQRACAARNKLPVEEKAAKEGNGKAHADTPAAKATDEGKRLSFHNLPLGPSGGTRQTYGLNGDTAMAFSRASRCSSTQMRQSARRRSFTPSEMRTWRTHDNRSPSPGAMRIYESVMTEKRLPSFDEIGYLESNAEQELRSLGVVERVNLEERIRERILLDKELKKSRRTLDKMIEKEFQKSTALLERRTVWGEKMYRIREKQAREEAERKNRILSDIERREIMYNRDTGFHSSNVSPSRRSITPDTRRS